MTLLSKRGCLLAAASVVVLSGTAGRGVTASAADKVTEWDQIAEDTVLRAGAFQGEGFVYMGYVSAAVYDAAVAVDPRYEPYRVGVTAPAGASADAAVVEAAYRTLLHYFPAQSAQLDPRYAASLATIGDGPAKVAGQAVGQAAADLIVALRANDGLRTPVATTSDFPHRTPGPGVWRLTPPAFAAPQTPWLGGVTPFLVDDVERFRPDGPPSLDSFEWVEAYEEVKRYGGADSTVRTPAQSATALFWTANVIRQYNRAVRDVIQAESLRLTDAARLQAMVNMTGADALIGALNAKYHFLFWRPVTAIDPSSVQPRAGRRLRPDSRIFGPQSLHDRAGRLEAVRRRHAEPSGISGGPRYDHVRHGRGLQRVPRHQSSQPGASRLRPGRCRRQPRRRPDVSPASRTTRGRRERPGLGRLPLSLLRRSGRRVGPQDRQAWAEG